jgi:GT2 family glycosyltransferase
MPDLSVIVVTYRSADKLQPFLNATRGVAPHAEIVIVDNASDDDTTQVARQVDATARIVQCDVNVGFGRACNLGASEARGGWLLFANPDLQLRRLDLPSTTDADDGLWSGSIAMEGGDLVPSPGMRADTSLPEDYVDQVFSHLLPPSMSSRIPVRHRPPGWASGALFLTSRATFQRVGGFDPRYFLYYEDRDLGARYRALEIPIRPLEGLVGVHHQGTSSSNVSAGQREGWSLLSWLEYLGKWKGQQTANRAAKMAYRTFAPIASLSGQEKLPARLSSKAERVAAVLHHLRTFEEQLPAGADGYYPCARLAVEYAFPSDGWQ